MKKNCDNFLFPRHNFDKWKQKQGDITRISDKSVVGAWLEQERKCIDCGYVQREYKEFF